MRHGKKHNHLGRKAGHRRSLLRNLSISLIEHKRIETTLAKAKALRRYIEPIVTKSKSNTTHARRVAFSYLQSKEAIKELFAVVGPAVADRPGGYVRVIRTGFRKGDGAELAMIEFVDFNPDYSAAETPEGAGGKTKRTRRRGGKGNKGGVAAATAATAATATKSPADTASEEEEEEE